jgi:hypothetical protein
MKEIIKNPSKITNIVPAEELSCKLPNTFCAGNAKLENTNPCGRQEVQVEQIEPIQAVACTEDCNCILPFCCRYTVPQGFGPVTEVGLEKEIFYYSNLYYVVDDEPCTVDVLPPEGCTILGVDIYPIRIVGCIPYVASVKIASENTCTHTATGSTENYTDPVTGLRVGLSLDQNLVINQVVGYVTSPEVSPVVSGQLIPCSDIQVAFIAGPSSCLTGSEDAQGTIIEFKGNFKIVNCPISDVIAE